MSPELRTVALMMGRGYAASMNQYCIRALETAIRNDIIRFRKEPDSIPFSRLADLEVAAGCAGIPLPVEPEVCEVGAA